MNLIFELSISWNGTFIVAQPKHQATLDELLGIFRLWNGRISCGLWPYADIDKIHNDWILFDAHADARSLFRTGHYVLFLHRAVLNWKVNWHVNLFLMDECSEVEYIMSLIIQIRCRHAGINFPAKLDVNNHLLRAFTMAEPNHWQLTQLRRIGADARRRANRIILTSMIYDYFCVIFDIMYHWNYLLN